MKNCTVNAAIYAAHIQEVEAPEDFLRRRKLADEDAVVVYRNGHAEVEGGGPLDDLSPVSPPAAWADEVWEQALLCDELAEELASSDPSVAVPALLILRSWTAERLAKVIRTFAISRLPRILAHHLGGDVVARDVRDWVSGKKPPESARRALAGLGLRL